MTGNASVAPHGSIGGGDEPNTDILENHLNNQEHLKQENENTVPEEGELPSDPEKHEDNDLNVNASVGSHPSGTSDQQQNDSSVSSEQSQPDIDTTTSSAHRHSVTPTDKHIEDEHVNLREESKKPLGLMAKGDDASGELHHAVPLQHEHRADDREVNSNGGNNIDETYTTVSPPPSHPRRIPQAEIQSDEQLTDNVATDEKSATVLAPTEQKENLSSLSASQDNLLSETVGAESDIYNITDASPDVPPLPPVHENKMDNDEPSTVDEHVPVLEPLFDEGNTATEVPPVEELVHHHQPVSDDNRHEQLHREDEDVTTPKPHDNSQYHHHPPVTQVPEEIVTPSTPSTLDTSTTFSDVEDKATTVNSDSQFYHHPTTQPPEIHAEESETQLPPLESAATTTPSSDSARKHGMLNRFRQHNHEFQTTEKPPIEDIPPERLHHSREHVEDIPVSAIDALAQQTQSESDHTVSSQHDSHDHISDSHHENEHQHQRSSENHTHYLLDDILEHYLDILPLSVKVFLMSQPFGLSLSTTLMATLIPFVVFFWMSVSAVLSALFGTPRVAAKVDIDYVRNLEGKFFSMEKEFKELKKMEGELASGGGPGSAELQAEVERLKTDLSTATQRLNQVVTQQEATKSENDSKIQAAETEIDRLTRGLFVAEDKVGELKETLDRKDAEETALHQQLGDLQEELDSKTRELQSVVENSEQLSNQIVSAREEIDKMTEQYNALQNYCSERVKEYEALYQSFTELEAFQNSENGDQDKEELLAKLMESSKVQAELETAKAELSRVQDELLTVKCGQNEIEDKIASIRDENAKLKQSETQAMQEKKEAETSLKVLTEYFTNRELELQKRIGEESVWRHHGENQTDNLQKRIASLEAENISFKEQAEYFKNELHTVELSHKAAIAKEEKKVFDSWTAARSFERELKEANAENATLRQQLTNAVAKGGSGNAPSFIPPPPGLIPPMPPPHLLNGPPPPWALRPPSDRSSQGASSPRGADSSMLQSSSSEVMNTSMASMSQTSPRRMGFLPPGQGPPMPPMGRGGPFPPPPHNHSGGPGQPGYDF